MEIRYYAVRANVPEPLWSPMLERTAADSTRDEVLAQMTTLTEGMTRYVAAR